jgi:hypothetical protein
MTPTETILARYSVIERETDSLGRTIGVKQLRPSESVRLNELTPYLEGETSIVSPDGKEISISHRSPMMIAASVREIDGNPIPFPKNRAELDGTLDALGPEGLEAAVKAYGRVSAGGAAPGEVVGTAKN